MLAHAFLRAGVLVCCLFLAFVVEQNRASWAASGSCGAGAGAYGAVQVGLGIGSFISLLPFDGLARTVTFYQAVTRTAHQTSGALLLAAAVVFKLRCLRHVTSVRRSSRMAEEQLSRPEADPVALETGGIGLKSMASVEPIGLAASEPGAILSVVTSRATAYLSLTKPRLVVLVLATVAAGFFLGARWESRPVTVMSLAATLVGTALVAGGAGALNQWLERDRDASDAADGRPGVAERADCSRASGGFRRTDRGRRDRRAVAGRGLAGRAGRVPDVRALRIRVHATENANDIEYARRGDSGCVAAADRLGGGGRGAWPGSVVVVPHRVSLAVPSFPGDCLDLSGGLPARLDFGC